MIKETKVCNKCGIEKPIDERAIWQDQFLNKWVGSASQEGVAKLEGKHNWNA